MANTILEMKNITKTFPGVKALNDVCLRVEQDEIHALVGENGAGKSTLMNVLSGIYPYGSYEGEIFFQGNLCEFHKIKDSEEKGIVIIHQELALVPYMSIAENMFLGNEQGRTAKINWNETERKARELLDIVGLKDNVNTLVKDISVGKQQLVEIAKALAKDVKLLILDEPTASLNETDSQKLLDLMLQLKKNGVTSIIISHKLNEISYVADKITVIRDGATIETLDKNKDDFTEAHIINAMVGRELTDRFPQREVPIGEIKMQVRDWTVKNPANPQRKACDNVSFNVRKGEVIGISGLMGAGRTELAMSIFGKSYGTDIEGEILIDGKPVTISNVQDAIDNKIAYVTEDRKGNGLILSNTIRVNTTLAKMIKIRKNKVTQSIDKREEKIVAEEYVEKMHTRCSGIEQPVGNLSGGNQQKVLLSRWMFADPEILILDEPTRGIDVGAKYEIYCIINQLAEEGKSVIMISSELPEILGMCDRIYVMNEGRFVAELDKNEASQESIMTCIVQSSDKGA